VEAAPAATATGLPRRRPGGADPAGHSGSRANPAAGRAAFPDEEQVRPMDPEEVRRRLSSFAEGVAAAARRSSTTGA
jgi:hypothetical protein